MQRKIMRAVLAAIGLTAAFAFVLTASVRSGMGQAPAAVADAPKTAEQVFKNIQVLKGVPADQLIPAMQFVTASLGVNCGFCHVEGQFEKDDKKPKETARKMMTMMFAINKNNFEGHRDVTCNSCHHGSTKPVATPIISDEPPKPMTAIAAAPAMEPDLSKLPPAGDLVDKYVQAIGGAAAIATISSRVEKGSITGFGGRKFPVEVDNQSPDKSVMLTHYPNGDSVTAYNGHEGWMVFPGRPARDLEGADLDAAKMDGDLHLPIDLKTMFSELKVAAPEKVGSTEAYQVVGLQKGQPPVQFYFDEQSGLLVRLVRYAESPLGLYPTRIDYADYRDQDGVKIPFTITTSRPGASSTLQIDQVQQNVPVEAAKFVKPPAPPPAEKK